MRSPLCLVPSSGLGLSAAPHQVPCDVVCILCSSQRRDQLFREPGSALSSVTMRAQGSHDGGGSTPVRSLLPLSQFVGEGLPDPLCDAEPVSPGSTMSLGLFPLVPPCPLACFPPWSSWMGRLLPPAVHRPILGGRPGRWAQGAEALVLEDSPWGSEIVCHARQVSGTDVLGINCARSLSLLLSIIELLSCSLALTVPCSQQPAWGGIGTLVLHVRDLSPER